MSFEACAWIAHNFIDYSMTTIELIFLPLFMFVNNYIHLWEMIHSPESDLCTRLFFSLIWNITHGKKTFLLFDVMTVINNTLWWVIQDAFYLFQPLLSQALSSICFQSCYYMFKPLIQKENILIFGGMLKLINWPE